MLQNNLRSVLSTLKAEKARLETAIAAIESLVSGEPAPAAKQAKPAAAKAPAKAAAPAATQKRAPRGLLKKMIYEALKSAKRTLAPYELRDAVVAAGYPVKDKATLYTTVFTTAKADKRIRKTKEGFSLIR